ncbi:MAG: hypothetical protein WC806_01155 [Candidatus Gracilibacteria bacterium]|jgi:hypothetical protein
METKLCKNCKNNFEIQDSDLAFYKKLDVPIPTLCHFCRSQRRLCYRNERVLYKRKSDYSGKEIISHYSQDKPFKVYENEAWWSDAWDPLEYGSAYDFSRSFFEQFLQLRKEVPRMALNVTNNENSPYINYAWYSKNCHLCFDVGYTEDVMYCATTYYSKDVVDTFFARECELCYYLIDCQKCYNSRYLQDCANCHDSYFSFDCKACTNIAFCSNLRNKSNYIFNKQVSKEEFEKFIKEIKQGSHKKYKEYFDDFKKVIASAIHKYTHNLNTENCMGDYILNSKNCFNCFDSEKCEDLKYCNRIEEKVVSSMDLDNAAKGELCYEGLCTNGVNLKFCTIVFNDSSDCTYCDLLASCSNCFGCVGLKHKNYCILNKQYSKEAYEEIVPRIIEHMKIIGEWGECFTLEDSPFCYNEAVVQEYFPLTKEQVLKKNWRWKEKDIKEYQKQNYEIPDAILDVPDSIKNEILACESCEKNYKIIEKELLFYKKLGLPIPRKCPDCRNLEMRGFRNPRVIIKRNCDNCGTEMETTYSQDDKKKVFCEKCYLEAL